jgi:hypothetical protein
MERFPQIADAVIHIEPPPQGWNAAPPATVAAGEAAGQRERR